LDKDLADFALNYAAGKKVEYAEARARKEKADWLIRRNGVLDAYVSTVDVGFCFLGGLEMAWHLHAEQSFSDGSS
jgi:hypothetical protein